MYFGNNVSKNPSGNILNSEMVKILPSILGIEIRVLISTTCTQYYTRNSSQWSNIRKETSIDVQKVETKQYRWHDCIHRKHEVIHG